MEMARMGMGVVKEVKEAGREGVDGTMETKMTVRPREVWADSKALSERGRSGVEGMEDEEVVVGLVEEEEEMDSVMKDAFPTLRISELDSCLT